ncbi:hypothetical protein DFH94DRAFT_87443 [Russula ochroleuca]|uniref:Uncharacterized protein n=1 Tax=Russula ochroleuca TaxID=152965 RepID=A0A9P5T6B4_9AGAM|nr:hypothetical protein DFH94DRAFT_87443 [Russula ochroleuca]
MNASDGEILREISRKLLKIHGAGLTDYEAWVLNDGINKLLREKGYLDDQIIAHGGAIYGRNITMIDDDDNGLDVLEAMGYKCIGRAKGCQV